MKRTMYGGIGTFLALVVLMIPPALAQNYSPGRESLDKRLARLEPGRGRD